jgi:uncharacterized membrane protein
MTLICVSLSAFRISYSNTHVFMFLNWNLFLAFVPWALTTFALVNPRVSRSWIALSGILVVWLLFFPNAPYILTDLFHLKSRTSAPIWFDLVLILSFAWTGLLFGFFSLWDIEHLLSRFAPPIFVRLISVSLLFLGSFGIYLGRYLRWNSWDIISDPFPLMYDIGDRVLNPLNHPQTWGMTIVLGLFLNMLYWSFRIIRSRQAHVSQVAGSH